MLISLFGKRCGARILSRSLRLSFVSSFTSDTSSTVLKEINGFKPINLQPVQAAEIVTNLRKDVSSDLDSAITILEGPFISKLDVRAIISCLKALHTVKNSDSFVIQNLENALTWRARTCSMRDLTLMLSFTVSRRSLTTLDLETDSSSKLFREIISSIERRWVEVSDARTFVSIVHYPECFKEGFICKLEDRITELVEKMIADDMVLILCCLGMKKRRSIPLMKALAFHLIRRREPMDIKTSSDCLFAMKQLSFRNEELMEALCQNMVSKMLECQDVSTTSTSLIPVLRSVLTSLGQLKFRHRQILDEITAYWHRYFLISEDGTSILKSRDLVAYLLCTATLNYIPKNSKEIFLLIEKKLTRSGLEDETNGVLIWLDVVWSLVLLNKATTEHFRSVLSSEYFQRLLYSHDHRNIGVILKMQNIQAASKLGFHGLDQPSDLLCLTSIARPSNAKLKHHRLLFETMQHLSSELKFNVDTEMGFDIDVECVYDALTESSLNVSKYSRFTKSKVAEMELEKTDNVIRIALLSVDYQDCLTNSELTGLSHLRCRLLESHEYSVILIRPMELRQQQKTLERVKILEAKIKKIIRSHTSNRQKND